ncbi:MAG: hypothetical protein ACTSUD_07980 [Alphaproteobacteria bacterium]
MVTRLGETGPLLFAMIAASRLTPDFLFSATELIFMVGEIPAAAASETPDPALRWANEAEMDIIAATVPRGELLREHYGADSHVVVIMEEGKVCALEWFVTPPRDCQGSWVFPQLEGLDWMHFRMAREDVWAPYVWVDPVHRGKRLLIGFQPFANIRFAGRKHTRSWGMIYSGNIKNIRAQSKRAYKIANRIVFARFLGLTFLCLDGALKIGIWTKNHPIEINLRASDIPEEKTAP